MSDNQNQTAIIWPHLIRQCVVDLAKIVEANKPAAALDLMAARLQTLLDGHDRKGVDQWTDFYEASRTFKELRASGRLRGRQLTTLEALHERATHAADDADLFVLSIRGLC